MSEKKKQYLYSDAPLTKYAKKRKKSKITNPNFTGNEGNDICATNSNLSDDQDEVLSDDERMNLDILMTSDLEENLQ
ncbi:hypothetical protein TSAR_007971, partial [Trichomalopsis sarcophagae]